jgi:hypothetical protein
MHGSFLSSDDRSHRQDDTCGSDVFFGQACPICGRKLRIAVNLLGRRVYCQHCGGGFVAADESLRSGEPSADGTFRACDETVDALLAKAEVVLSRVGGSGRISR